MADPRVNKLAQVMVHYSLELKPKQHFAIVTTPFANELALAVYTEAIKAGANVFVMNALPGAEEAFYKHASGDQLDAVSPIRKLITETFDARLFIDAEYNTRELSGVDTAKVARARKASAPLSKIFMERSASGAFRWCVTVYPTYAMAQEADMSLSEYAEFVYGAGLLNDPDPVSLWRKEGERQMKLIRWLDGKDKAVLKGENVDLTMSIKGRTFKEADGKYNFPDGEIFTGPVEDSVNGWIRFRYPAIYSGQEVTDIELWFENGKVVKEKASKGQGLLTSLLNTDAGARYLGEWGIGTNYGIQRFTKNMLFDEKMGGTIHLAVGASYPETGGKNESGVHWDMLCDMAQSEIKVDGELFYKDGKPVV
ncbi:MAG: aminopeptidase [Chloroflexi bacterium]|nr:aminopeptidase [Chloroflexota bacterium]MBI5715511.1 aminopeptidase [Chloroflexota bacterium]